MPPGSTQRLTALGIERPGSTLERRCTALYGDQRKKVGMILLAVLGGTFVVGLAAAALYDHRARRRGERVGVSRIDIEEREGYRYPYSPPPDEGGRR